jgi:hypothetical protein
MKYTWLAALLIAAMPAFAQAQRYDRGVRYDRGSRYHGGSSHSFFDFSIGFGSRSHSDFGFGRVSYRNYDRPIYRAPVRYYEPAYCPPPPVVIYRSSPVYVPPPVYVPAPATYYQPTYSTTYYSSPSPYYCSPAVTSYTTVRYYYGR